MGCLLKCYCSIVEDFHNQPLISISKYEDELNNLAVATVPVSQWCVEGRHPWLNDMSDREKISLVRHFA